MTDKAIATSGEFPTSTEMDEDEYQSLFDDELEEETELNFTEDHVREWEQESGIYESIEHEVEDAADEAAVEPVADDDGVIHTFDTEVPFEE